MIHRVFREIRAGTRRVVVVTMVIVIAMLAAEGKLSSGTEAIAAEKPNQLSSVTITPSDRGSGPRTFSIALICDTDEARTKGLQGFRRLGTNEAALFVLGKPDVVTFWMGSVAYPIDIIFIGSNKKVNRIYANCKPGSRELYTSGGDTALVIETAAGSGIGAGDRVEFK